MESFSQEICKGIQHMSEAVFGLLIQKVGTSQQVALRRETEDIRERVNRLESSTKYSKMLSGSRREGFRLNGSDIDYMQWLKNHRVIMDMSQSDDYNKDIKTLIFADSSNSPPGFTLLQLLTSTTVRYIKHACDNNFYISSYAFKEHALSEMFSCSNIHGPCSSGEIYGMEYDIALCFRSDIWPPSACSWINRCHSWPETDVVCDIIRDGCHFVAIGHPLGQYERKEWRISFSQAEQKCVYAMKHCQFLIYGLLKLFLKEVISQQSEETNALLCSYHMKTAVFWALQQNLLSNCSPQNLLAGFWTCFKILLKWVYEGICPNFFIPENNMFLTKVHGLAQQRLFEQLHQLYTKGLACLMQSSSIRNYIIFVLSNPTLTLCIDKSTITNEVDFDIEFFSECFAYVGTKTALQTVEDLISSRLTECQTAVLQNLTAVNLQYIAFLLLNRNTYTIVNKRSYITCKMSFHMLKLAAKLGYVSDMLYIVMYYYKTFRLREALSVLEITKAKFAQPYVIYTHHVDRVSYKGILSGKSWHTKMRCAVVRDIILDNRICYINELTREQHASLEQKTQTLEIPVLVMLYFLEFLCYRHIDATLSQAALFRLQSLVQRDRGLYLPYIYKDISWEILGICQETTGDLQAALLSYQQSLSQIQYHRIQSATQMRIHDIRC